MKEYELLNLYEVVHWYLSPDYCCCVLAVCTLTSKWAKIRVNSRKIVLVIHADVLLNADTTRLTCSVLFQISSFIIFNHWQAATPRWSQNILIGSWWLAAKPAINSTCHHYQMGHRLVLGLSTCHIIFSHNDGGFLSLVAVLIALCYCWAGCFFWTVWLQLFI